MKLYRFLIVAVCVSFVLGAWSCGEGSDVTSANKSLVQLSVDAPDTAKSGASFGVDVRALNIGLGSVREGKVTVVLPAPLTVLSVSSSSGTSATFSNGISGGRVDWDLGSLDSNSQSRLTITAMGVLLPTEATKKLTVVANMTARGINAGDAVAQDDVTLIQ